MRESLLTIPINEVFEPNEDGLYCGCPFCKMRDRVENHICEYIMGAAMMEPDVRQDTNALGFCHRHFVNLLGQKNRLSLGLMLNSHLASVREDIFSKKGIFEKDKKSEKAMKAQETCFVCTKVNWGMSHMVKTFFVMFRDDDSFKGLFNRQEFICMPHYAWIRSLAPNYLTKAVFSAFLGDLDTLVGDYATQLNIDVGEFCDSFDYRNAGKLHKPEYEQVRTAVNRSIYFLTGRSPQ
jgi:hypothetical protein